MADDGELFGSSCLFDAFGSNGESDSAPVKDGQPAGQDEDVKDSTAVSNDGVNGDDDFVVLDETGSEGVEDGDVTAEMAHDPPKKQETVPDSDSVEILGEGASDSASTIELSSNGKDKLATDVDSQSTIEKSPITVASADLLDSGSCTCEDCPHLRELLKLKLDNELLREQIQKLTSQLRVTNRKFADVEITFLNQLAELRYRQQVEEFLGRLLEQDGQASPPACHEVKISETSLVVEEFTEFRIDKSSLSQPSSQESDEWKLPSYSQEFEVPSMEENVNGDETPPKASKASCFNCLGDHMLTECPIPKDKNRITQNRDEFWARTGNIRQTRYHADDDLKFAGFKPGVISKDLRRALDYRSDELPSYIYLMRELGYPPGWLKEAEIVNSGLTMYDSDGKEMEENKEEGEVREKGDVQVKYDPSRIIDYPGFNVPPKKGIRDDWRRYGFLPMQDHHRKSYVTRCMKAPDAVPYKRKPTNQSPMDVKRLKVVKPDCNVEVTDMDIEDDTLPVNVGHASLPNSPPPSRSHRKETPSTPSYKDDLSGSEVEMRDEPDNQTGSKRGPAPPYQSPDVVSSSESTRAVSPSLEDLEIAKARLVLQLKDDSTVGSSAGDSSASGSQTPVRHSQPTAQGAGKFPLEDASNGAVGGVSVTDRSPGATKSLCASKAMHLGSPAIIQLSRGMTMPEPEKFAVGVSEHIPYENLPDSTGQYERMKEVLKKIRETNSVST